MDYQLMHLVCELDLKPNLRHVLMVYATFANREGKGIRPSIKTMVRRTGYTDRSIQMITHALLESGYLQPDGKGQHGVNQYSIAINRGEKITGEIISGEKITGEKLSGKGEEITGGGEKLSIKGVKPDSPKELIKEQGIKSEKEFYLEKLEQAADNLGFSYSARRRLIQDLELETVSLARQNGSLIIRGMGKDIADFHRDRYLPSLRRYFKPEYELVIED